MTSSYLSMHFLTLGEGHFVMSYYTFLITSSTTALNICYVIKIIQKKYPPNLFLIDVSHFLFVFYSILYFFKSLKRKLTSLCCSKDCWRGYICTPSWAQTHMIAHTKGEPRARLSNPFSFFSFFAENLYQKLSIASQSLITFIIQSIP